MITWDDDPNNERAKMPCGHAIGPYSLTIYCRSLLSAGKYVFVCPYKDPNTKQYCDQAWDYFIVRKNAILSEEERSEFETKLSQNYMRRVSGIQECPKCTSFCIRQNKKDKRVVCLFCSKDGDRYEFCWNCLGAWKTCGTDKCGNEACTGEDPRLKILREASKIVIIGLQNCPSIRACPKCGALISHREACKHMVCICGQMFCFICLKRAVNGKYQCGFFNSHCTIAAVQTKMPGDEVDESNGSDENEEIESRLCENEEIVSRLCEEFDESDGSDENEEIESRLCENEEIVSRLCEEFDESDGSDENEEIESRLCGNEEIVSRLCEEFDESDGSDEYEMIERRHCGNEEIVRRICRNEKIERSRCAIL